MKRPVLMTVLFPIFTYAVSEAEPNFEKYRAYLPDSDVQRLNGALRRLEAYSSAARAGGNVSGGGPDLYEMTEHDRRADGAGLQKRQISLLMAS